MRCAWHAWLLRIPLVGRLVRAANTALCTRTLALLTASAVPLLDSLYIAAQVMPNLPMRAAVRRAALKVREGSAFRARSRRKRLFPAGDAAPHGERRTRGRTRAHARRSGEPAKRELDRWITTLTAMIGPLVILVVGAMVLFIVLAILLPIFDLNQMVK